ncbi:MAG: ribonuclease J [Ruminococcus sp.]|nr:ribonuclease J [Ruminococcus sp.]MBQ5630509.1 ribonuclease J [Ruminococcus sp.]
MYMYAEISIPILVFIRNGLIYDRNKSEEYGGNFVSKERNNRNFKLKNTNIGKGQAKSKSAKSSKPKANRRPQRPTKPSVKVSFLGGLNEIGKNITLIECEGDMIIIDCGMAFPDGDMLGVDLVIPDFTYIEQNFDKVKGIVLTHGHEDHIGGLPYLLSRVNIPIYGTPLTLGLVGNKLKEHSLFNKAKLNVVNAGDIIRLGCMEVKFIHVNHSIPDAVAFAIRTPAGTLVHTGDFKIDCTPILGDAIDFSSFAQAGDEGVLALLAESTNASRPGFTRTERLVSDSLNMLFNNAANYRIIIATFASNVNRVQQIIDCAAKYGRKVAFSGRSMVNYMDVAKKLGYLNVPDNILIDLDMLDKYPREQIVLVTTGSQGEPMSALSRMAYSDHRKVVVGEGDFIIISANPIPGNEKTVGNVVDELLKRGCKVIYESMYDVHVSGHACQEELKIIHRLVRPKFFIPVHGEQKHLRKHADLAEFLGMDRKNIFIGDVGSTVEINEDYMKEIAPVPAGKVFVDGLGVGDVGSIVLRDRKHLGQDGLIIIVASLDVYDGHVISGPDVVSRGFVYVRESEQLLEEVRKLALDILEDCADNNIHEWGIIKNRIKDEISKLIAQRTRRAPMILPILQEV